jgi:hypothetical protein
MVDFDSSKDKAEEFAGNKVGHQEQIDQGADKLKGMIPAEGGDESAQS